PGLGTRTNRETLVVGAGTVLPELADNAASDNRARLTAQTPGRTPTRWPIRRPSQKLARRPPPGGAQPPAPPPGPGVVQRSAGSPSRKRVRRSVPRYGSH